MVPGWLDTSPKSRRRVSVRSSEVLPALVAADHGEGEAFSHGGSVAGVGVHRDVAVPAGASHSRQRASDAASGAGSSIMRDAARAASMKRSVPRSGVEGAWQIQQARG